MWQWRVAIREPSLEELLADDVTQAVMRSDGLKESELRGLMAELKRRLPAERLRPPGGCLRECGYRPSAA